MSWDWVISGIIIVGLVLGFWAKITRQTIGELFADIKDKMVGGAEDTVEGVRELTY